MTTPEESGIGSKALVDAFGVALPFELTQLFDPLECKLCHVKATSAASAYAHYEGKTHLKNVNKFLQDNFNITHQYKKVKSEFQATTCETCCVTISSEIQAQLHFNGKTHARNLKNPAAAWRKVFDIDLTDKLSTPDVEINGEESAKGDGEAGAEEEKGTKEENKAGDEDDWPYCELCDIYCNTEAQMDMHKTGSKHLKNVAYFSKLVKDEVTHKKVSAANSKPLELNTIASIESDSTQRQSAAPPDSKTAQELISDSVMFPNYLMQYPVAPPQPQPLIVPDPITTLAQALTSLVTGALGQCQPNYYQPQPTLYDPRMLMYQQQQLPPTPPYPNTYTTFNTPQQLEMSHIQAWLPYYKNYEGRYQCLPCNCLSKTPDKFVEHLNSDKHKQSMLKYYKYMTQP